MNNQRETQTNAMSTTHSAACKYDEQVDRYCLFLLVLMTSLLVYIGCMNIANAAPTASLKRKQSNVGFDRLITLGVGVQGGYFHAGGSKQIDDDNRGTFGVQLHLRLLKIFGFTVAYDFNDANPIMGEEVQMPYPSLRLTGHLYLANIGPIHINLLAGLGFNFGEENGGNALAAYILGAEVGFRIHARFVVIAGFHFALPSYEQTTRNNDSLGLGNQFPNGVDAQDLPAVLDAANAVKNIFDFRNFNVTVSARFFL